MKDEELRRSLTGYRDLYQPAARMEQFDGHDVSITIDMGNRCLVVAVSKSHLDGTSIADAKIIRRAITIDELNDRSCVTRFRPFIAKMKAEADRDD